MMCRSRFRLRTAHTCAALAHLCAPAPSSRDIRGPPDAHLPEAGPVASCAAHSASRLCRWMWSAGKSGSTVRQRIGARRASRKTLPRHYAHRLPASSRQSGGLRAHRSVCCQAPAPALWTWFSPQKTISCWEWFSRGQGRLEQAEDSARRPLRQCCGGEPSPRWGKGGASPCSRRVKPPPRRRTP